MTSSSIQPIETTQPTADAIPTTVDDVHIVGDYRITERGEARITEDGIVVQLE